MSVAPSPVGAGQAVAEPSAAGSDLLDTLAFWREVAKGARPDHPSHVVVRVLEGLARCEERRA